MLAVSNTSPILALAIIGRLSLLADQFGEVRIPRAVLDELRIGEEMPGSRDVREAINAGWLLVQDVSDHSLVSVLQRELDQGEAEAIALTLQLKASWTLLDEREARRVAKSLGLRVTGVLGILMRAKREGRIESLRTAIEELRVRVGFRVAPELVEQLIAESGEELVEDGTA